MTTMRAMMGRLFRSAVAPRPLPPSPELEAIREATTAVKDAADHLVKSAEDISTVVRKLRLSNKPCPRKKKASAK